MWLDQNVQQSITVILQFSLNIVFLQLKCLYPIAMIFIWPAETISLRVPLFVKISTNWITRKAIFNYLGQDFTYHKISAMSLKKNYK